MATSLNKTLVAEGIETEAQAKLISDLGCTVVQGFLFSKPISATDFEKLIYQESIHWFVQIVIVSNLQAFLT